MHPFVRSLERLVAVDSKIKPSSHTIIFKPNMASSSKRSCMRLTAEEVAELCAQSDNDKDSELDSKTGGLSSGEEFELNQEMDETSDSDVDTR